MKKLALSLIAVLVATSGVFAGQQVTYKDYKGTSPDLCFRDTELQLDLFGSYNARRGFAEHGDGWGGGIGVNYYFHRNIGVSASGNIYDGDTAIWNADLDILVRFPIDSACLAPYILAGGGIESDGTTVGNVHTGAGLEWRATDSIGIFGEGRYYWGANDQDGVQARFGVRFVF